MRPYLVFAVVTLVCVSAFSQQAPVPRPYGLCLFGCGPYVPLITTPMISLEQYSPNPVGAAEHH